jgi:predicted transcriptional regulator
MSNKEMNAYLQYGAPPGVKLSGSECAIYLIICHRYDTRADVMSAYPGMDEFRRVTTLSRSAVECALARLKSKGLITQVQKGYVGKRAEYVPTYSINLLSNGESVAYINTLKDEVSSTPAESVSNTGRESRVDEQRVSSTPVTISTVSTVSNNKYDLFRFNLIVLSALPERLRTLSPGVNYEKLLDECDELGISDEVRRVIATNRWDNVQANAGGIVHKLIKESIERKRSGQLVVAPEQVSYVPPPYVEEIREIEPMSPETREIVEKTRRKLKGFGAIPE